MKRVEALARTGRSLSAVAVCVLFVLIGAAQAVASIPRLDGSWVWQDPRPRENRLASLHLCAWSRGASW